MSLYRMPFSRRYSRYARRYRRRRRVQGRRRYVRRRGRRRFGKIRYMKVRGTTGLPDQLYCKLRYQETINMTNVIGFGTYRFALNGLYDPNITGTGHQPMYFDQYMGLYNTYEARASKINCRFNIPSTVNAKFAIYPSADSTTVGNISTASEQPYVRTIWLTNSNSFLGRTATNYMSTRKIEGRNTDSLNFIGTSSANPASIKYWHLMLASTSGDDISQIDIDVTIIYYVRFMRRKAQGQS